MKKITKEQFEEATKTQKTRAKTQNPILIEIGKLAVGEGISVEKNEWKYASKLSSSAHIFASRRKMRLSITFNKETGVTSILRVA